MVTLVEEGVTARCNVQATQFNIDSACEHDLTLNERILHDAEFADEFILLPDGSETVYNGPCDDGLKEVVL